MYYRGKKYMVNIGYVTIQGLRHLLEFLQRNSCGLGRGWGGGGELLY